MTIETFKQLKLHEKLLALKHDGNLLGPYERNGENGGPKTPGDIYELFDFFVYLSEDETLVIPSRRNPLPAV
jgi:hypothetical protein